MIKNKTFELLKTLSSRDFKKLGEFLKSPLHNKNKRLILLYGILEEHYPNFKLSRRFLFERLHPGKSYKDNVMRKILSSFNGRIEEYLAYTNFNRDRLGIQKHLISELNKRNAEKFVEENYRGSEDIMNYSRCHEDRLDFRYKLELEKNILYLKSNKFSPDKSILNESDYLIKFFLLKIMRRYAYILNKNTYELNFEFKPVFLEEILKHLNENTYDDIPAIPLYHNIILLMKNENETGYFDRVVKILNEYEKELDRIDIYNSYFILNNYYGKKNDSGKDTYVKELFALYKTQLSKEIYKYEDYIHPSLFVNIIKAGTRLKEFDWTDKFIEKYISEIDPIHRQSTYSFSRAVLSFFKKDYDSSLGFLNNIKINGIFHRLDVYTYMLRIYYEKNEIEPIMYLVDSFKHTLAKDRLIPEFKRREYNSFLKFLNYLVKMKHSHDYSTLGLFKSELEDIHCVSCTGWFMEKFSILDLQYGRSGS